MSYPPFHEFGTQAPLALTGEAFAQHFPAEGDHLEFKQGVPESKISEAVAAFSNTDGGVVLLGVSDSGSPGGLRADGDTEAKVHRAVRNVRDPGRYLLDHLSVDDHDLLVIAVSRRREGFAQLQDGRILVRRGAMNVPLLGGELTRFLAERALTRFESTATRISLAEADPLLAERLVAAYGWSSLSNDRLLEIGLLAPGRAQQLTIAGALYLTPRPRELLGKAYVEIFRYREGRTWDRRIQLDGPIDQQVEQTVQTLLSELGSDLVILGVRRHDVPRLPEPVLREAVANAVAHRSYEQSAQAVRVEIHPERVLIRSPGGLPEPVTLENMRDQNAPRNLDVIKVLRRLRLAEDAGRGVDLMQDEMEAAMLDAPVFDSDGTYVSVSLPLASAVRPQERAWLAEVEDRGQIKRDDRVVLLHAARGNILTNTTVRNLIGVDSTHARASLVRLRDLGYLAQQGERGGATYTLAQDLGPPPGLQLAPDQLREVVSDLVDEKGRVSNEDVRLRTGLDRARAVALLASMVEMGLLRRHGERRGSYYTAPEVQ